MKKRSWYSTDPDFVPQDESQTEIPDTLPKQQQKLRVTCDRKQRAGKEVTLVTDFVGKPEDLEVLGKWLKTKCGVGGSIKDEVILLQGNHVAKVLEFLLAEGYSQTKKIG